MNKAKELTCLTLGSILLSAGIYFFKLPNNFVTGGCEGISVLLAHITPISSGSWILILNFSLLLLGFTVLGKSVGIKTVYSSMLYSLLTALSEKILPIEAPLTSEPCLELAYAMILTSIGSAMCFYAGGSSGGTDIVALILKNTQISMWENRC